MNKKIHKLIDSVHVTPSNQQQFHIHFLQSESQAGPAARTLAQRVASRAAMRNSPFSNAEQPKPQLRTGCFAFQNSPNCNPLAFKALQRHARTIRKKASRHYAAEATAHIMACRDKIGRKPSCRAATPYYI